MRASTHGQNRTAVSVNPRAAADQAAFAQSTPPSSEGDGSESGHLRQRYEKGAPSMGSLPVLAGKKTIGRAALFLDRLGERLAFERSSVRLYEALLSKHGAPTPVGAGSAEIDRERLEQICAEEYQHFMWLVGAINDLGGDPTAITPAANISAVLTSGLPTVIHDPRTSFNQCLDAFLVAELTDNDGWMVLIDLAQEIGQKELASQFREALAHEQEHLATIRELVANRSAP